MRLLVYSDVHGNLPAFEAMLKQVGVCDGYICLGDLVNYGPWSNACVDLACSLPNSVLLMGNHEEAFIAGSYPGQNKLVKLFFETTFPAFDRFEKIKCFKPNYQLGDFRFTHTLLNESIYPDTTISLDNDCVIGHSHHQFVYRYTNFTLYNAGSVGQNRGYINVANYLVSNTGGADFEMKQLTYDLDVMLDKMRAEKYPDECIQYYQNKKRA